RPARLDRSLARTFPFCVSSVSVFFFADPPTTEIYTLSLHDALPICSSRSMILGWVYPAMSSDSAWRWPPESRPTLAVKRFSRPRSEEHTSELQSRENLVCRLLLEKKKNKKRNNKHRRKSTQ